MSFLPVVPAPGLAGWKFLQRTYDAQFQAFNASPQQQRDVDYFSENIQNIRSAEELVKDRRLLNVALGAFGLQSDIDNRYFVQKILSDGTQSDDALANKLADDRYKEFSKAFAFGPGESPSTTNPASMATIVSRHQSQSFEIAVGEQDDAMRIALYAQRELAALAHKNVSEETKWYSLMGLPPLRSMFETALGLPNGFGQIDIDKQYTVFREKTRTVTGNATVSQFSDPDSMEQLTRLFLARAQLATLGAANSSGANALVLLQSAS